MGFEMQCRASPWWKEAYEELVFQKTKFSQGSSEKNTCKGRKNINLAQNQDPGKQR